MLLKKLGKLWGYRSAVKAFTTDTNFENGISKLHCIFGFRLEKNGGFTLNAIPTDIISLSKNVGSLFLNNGNLNRQKFHYFSLQ